MSNSRMAIPWLFVTKLTFGHLTNFFQIWHGNSVTNSGRIAIQPIKIKLKRKRNVRYLECTIISWADQSQVAPWNFLHVSQFLNHNLFLILLFFLEADKIFTQMLTNPPHLLRYPASLSIPFLPYITIFHNSNSKFC